MDFSILHFIGFLSGNVAPKNRSWSFSLQLVLKSQTPILPISFIFWPSVIPLYLHSSVSVHFCSKYVSSSSFLIIYLSWIRMFLVRRRFARGMGCSIVVSTILLCATQFHIVISVQAVSFITGLCENSIQFCKTIRLILHAVATTFEHKL